jgi:hypothetical protein
MCVCDPIFKDFEWCELATLRVRDNRLDGKGVYALRVRERGDAVGNIISDVKKCLDKLGWLEFEDFVMSRVSRLENIQECPIIYVGAAPNTLKGRYRDLCGRRHTALFAVLALLHGGWKLEFGWLKCDNPLQKEKILKEQYRNVHGKLPALMKR